MATGTIVYPLKRRVDPVACSTQPCKRLRFVPAEPFTSRKRCREEQTPEDTVPTPMESVVDVDEIICTLFPLLPAVNRPELRVFGNTVAHLVTNKLSSVHQTQLREAEQVQWDAFNEFLSQQVSTRLGRDTSYIS